MSYVSHETVVKLPRSKVFQLLSQPQTYARLMPESLKLELTSPEISLKPGAEFEFKVTQWGLPHLLSLRVEEVKANEELVLSQAIGVFGRYRHTVKLKEHGPDSTFLGHYVDYDLRFGVFGKLFDDLFLKRYFQTIFKSITIRLPRLATHSHG